MNILQQKLIRAFVCLAAVSCSLSTANAQQVSCGPPVQQAFLVQNSGWMQPFYTDPSSQFKGLVKAFSDYASANSEPLHLLRFSQSDAESGVSSPGLQFSGSERIPTAAINAIGLEQKNNGKLADSDLAEAIKGTVTGPFKGAEGIIWIFTNNKNSPNNSLETREKNAEFYQVIYKLDSISQVVAYPVPMKVSEGSIYSANGLMIYGLVYGNSEKTQRFFKCVTQSRLSRFPGLGGEGGMARLKPLDQAAFSAQVGGNDLNNANGIELSSRGSALTISVDGTGSIPKPSMSLDLINEFYPFSLTDGSLSVRVASFDKSQSYPVAFTSSSGDKIALQPGQAIRLDINNMQLPVTAIPSGFSTEVIRQFGDPVIRRTWLIVDVNNQQLKLSESFVQTISQMFPNDPLPDVFTPPKDLKASSTAIPMLIKVNYPIWPVFLVVASLLLLVSLLITTILFAGKKIEWKVVVDGKDEYREVLKFIWDSKILRTSTGKDAGTIKQYFGRTVVSDNKRIKIYRIKK